MRLANKATPMIGVTNAFAPRLSAPNSIVMSQPTFSMACSAAIGTKRAIKPRAEPRPSARPEKAKKVMPRQV